MSKNILTSVRDKLLLKAGYKVDSLNHKYTEEEINARVLTPFCAIDIAYAAFQTLPKDYFRQENKRWHNEALKKFKHIFGVHTGVLYSGMTMDEIGAVNDYMEKLTEENQKYIDILKWQIRAHLMHFSTEDREIIATLIFVMTICCFSHDMLVCDLHTNFLDLDYISVRASKIVEKMRLTILGKDAPAFDFTDKQFEQTLTILFKRLSGTTTDGIC